MYNGKEAGVGHGCVCVHIYIYMYIVCSRLYARFGPFEAKRLGERM